jgi:hypothetical protein
MGGAPQFINEGLFWKTSGAGTNKCSFPFINRGTISIDTGGLFMAGTYTHPSGTISLANGTFRTAHPIVLESGSLTGSGIVLSDVTSAATVAPHGLDGSLTVVGNYRQLLAGSVEFELAGGAPLSGPALHITGDAQLNGSLGVHWVDGLVPPAGREYELMSFAGSTGEFCCWNGLIFLGQGRSLVPARQTSRLGLLAQDAPEPPAIPLRIAVGDQALVCWPWEFLEYELFFKTNLNQAAWTFLPGATNRWLEPIPLPSEKYFQLYKRSAAGGF